MNNFPSDPDTGVCLSGGLASLSRQAGVRGQTEGPGYTDLPRDTREEGNIGSIITMLITDQTVDLEDYLTDPILSHHQHHQHHQQHTETTMFLNNIKEEETLCEAVSASPPCQSPGAELGSHHYRTQSVSEGDEDYQASHHLQYTSAFPGLTDISTNTNTTTNYNNNLDRETGEGLRDDKYWERRR